MPSEARVAQLLARPSAEHLICPNCQEWVELQDGRSPHVDLSTPIRTDDWGRAIETEEELVLRLTCPRHPMVVHALSGARSDDLVVEPTAQVQTSISGVGTVVNP